MVTNLPIVTACVGPQVSSRQDFLTVRVYAVSRFEHLDEIKVSPTRADFRRRGIVAVASVMARLICRGSSW